MLRKQEEVNAKVRKKKLESKRCKRNKTENVVAYKSKPPLNSDETEDEKSDKDTVHTTFANYGNENYVILVLKKAHPPGKDSMYVASSDADTLSSVSQNQIKSFLESYSIGAQDKIILKESIEYSNRELMGNSKQKEKVIRYLEKLGIKRKQIFFKE